MVAFTVDSFSTIMATRPGQLLLEKVPVPERSNFLKYQLALAINSNSLEQTMGKYQELKQGQRQNAHLELLGSNKLVAIADEFQDIASYDNFPQDLLAWLAQSYDIEKADIYRSIRSWLGRSQQQQLCNAQGQCYEVAQISAVCCPF